MDVFLTLYRIQNTFFPKTIKSDRFISYLKHMSISIGEGTIIYNPSSVTIDVSRPHLLKIGKYCKITGGVTILAHDYSRSVLRIKYGELIADARDTIIQDNVFIGMNSIVLMGSHIGSNVIVGAGSVVSGYIPDNVVIAGNPARVLMSLEEYYSKRKNELIDAAFLYFKEYKQHYKKQPTIEDMNSFFPLYLEREVEALKKNHIRTALGGDNEKDLIQKFLASQPVFQSYNEFVQYCENRISDNS